MAKKRISYTNFLSKECIVSAILQLINDKPLSSISVSELCSKAGVSRMTFYRNYDSIEDIFVTTQSYLDNLMIRTGLDYHYLKDTKELFKVTTLMLMDKEYLSRRYVDQYITANEIQAENLIEVSTMDLLIEFATIGIGIACVIKNFVEQELKDGTLVEIPMPFSIPKRNIGLVYPKKQYRNPSLESFLEFYKEYV